MKRIALLAIVLILALSLTSCGNSSASSPGSNSSSTASSTSNGDYSSNDVSFASSSANLEPQIDNNGIPGMNSFPIKMVLESDPFGIPADANTPAPEEAAGTFSSYCVSSGSETPGVLYDYSLTLDSDDEIIGASFGVSSTTATESELLMAADLFFYAVAINPYDTADQDTLTTWVSDNLSTVTADGAEITVGDAVFQMYGIPGAMYWIDISKAN